MSVIWNEYLVGVLAEDALVYDRTGGRSAVFVNSLKIIQFAVRSISRPPAGFPNVKMFYGFSKDLERHGFLDDFAAPPADRTSALREFLREQLLVFRPSNNGQYFNITDVSLVALPLAHKDHTTYVPVPVFSQEVHQFDFERFMQRLAEQQFIGQITHISQEQADTPSFVIWREQPQAGQSWRVIGSFNRHRYGNGGFQLIAAELRLVAFREDWENDMFEVPNDHCLLFVSDETHSSMQQALEQGIPYTQQGTSSLQQLADEQGSNAEDAQAEPPRAEPLTPEQEFIRRLEQTAVESGLLYDPADLINFHTAMKTSSLVVLAGLSGTGKSRLVQTYGRALGLDEQQLVFIPVRPSWTDDADLIGYVDTMRLVYRPGESGLLQTLVLAATNPDRLYLICLDEMNLARVEHYFSQLLSVLEMAPADRRLRLYHDDLAPQLFNSSQYPPAIPLGDNLLFAGTVNLDESTYRFSDKVLDRANVIGLSDRPFSELQPVMATRRMKAPPEILAGVYRSFSPRDQQLGLTARETAFLQQIHSLMRHANRNQGIGYRIVRQIGNYLMNLPKTTILTRAEALDRQLVQRVLTKLRGPEEQLRSLLGRYQDDPEQLVKSPLLDLLDEYADLAPFTTCRQVLLQKGKDLVLYGYTV